jgi:hypothetical protein
MVSFTLDLIAENFQGFWLPNKKPSKHLTLQAKFKL